MIVLGLDPGTSHHGWALLEMPRTGRGRMLAGGHMAAVKVPVRFQAISDWIDSSAWTWTPWIDVVGIETPAGYIHEHKRGAALLATAVEAGKLIERAGRLAVVLSAAQVRKSLAKNPAASDEAVASALGVFLDMPKRSNVHARDAAAVALVAWQRWMVDHGREVAV